MLCFLGFSVREKKFDNIDTCGLYYKHIMIVNEDFRVVRMMLQVVVSPTIVILTTLEVSSMFQENIHSQASPTIVTYSSKYFIVQATGVKF
jgi:hypothetical protein